MEESAKKILIKSKIIKDIIEMSVKDDKLETAGQAHLRAGSAVSLVFSKRWFILVTGELPIV